MTAQYKALKRQKFSYNEYALVPIRYQDRYAIMKWRNEQIYHLRQNKPLTRADQDTYFENVVAKLFYQEQPDQILFSFMEEETCIGYGGLVHINWVDKNAEISFIMDTSIEAIRFHEVWLAYLPLIEQVAFMQLRLHKIFTYAYDLRPQLYTVLREAGFREEARLEEHVLFGEKYIDVLIHAKWNGYQA